MAESKADTRSEKLFQFTAYPKRLFEKDASGKKVVTGWRLKTRRDGFPVSELKAGKGVVSLPKGESLYHDLTAHGIELGEEYYQCDFEVTESHVVFNGKTETAVRVGLLEFLKNHQKDVKLNMTRSWRMTGYAKEEEEEEELVMDLFQSDDEW